MSENRSTTPLERGLAIAGITIIGSIATAFMFRQYGGQLDNYNRDPQPTVTEVVDMPDPVTTTIAQP